MQRFLHEFKHVKDVNEGKRVNEENARGWSLSVMYKVNPAYLKKIVQKGMVRFLTEEDLEEILLSGMEDSGKTANIIILKNQTIEEDLRSIIRIYFSKIS